MRQTQSLSFEVHEHHFVSGPRATAGYRNGVWTEPKFAHSHPGGDVPHTHPNTGPSFYGYRQPKVTKKPTGEQGLAVIPRTEEENTFDLVITDSALISRSVPIGQKAPPLAPIGNTPLDVLGFPAAQSMILGARMKCNIRDERKCMIGHKGVTA